MQLLRAAAIGHPRLLLVVRFRVLPGQSGTGNWLAQLAQLGAGHHWHGAPSARATEYPALSKVAMRDSPTYPSLIPPCFFLILKPAAGFLLPFKTPV